MKNKVVVVLGSQGRIGNSLCEYLYQSGYNVIGLDIIKAEKSKKYENIKINLSDEKKLKNLINKISLKYKKIDSVINCIYPISKYWGKEINTIKKKELDYHFSIHLSDCIIQTRSFVNQFKKQNFGNFIYFSSIQGLTAPKFDHYKGTGMNSCIEYSIIKAGIINMTKYLAKFYKKQKIRFNCISLGGIENNQPNNFKKKYREACLSKGLLDPEDIHSAVDFLISDKSNFVNGQNIIVDDGWSL